EHGGRPDTSPGRLRAGRGRPQAVGGPREAEVGTGVVEGRNPRGLPVVSGGTRQEPALDGGGPHARRGVHGAELGNGDEGGGLARGLSGAPEAGEADAPSSVAVIPLGRVREIVRYPVKSMAGTATESALLGLHGLDGDRRFAFRRIGDEGGFPW